MKEDAAVIDWLLEGDPAIRWQAMRDLLDEPEAAWRRSGGGARSSMAGWRTWHWHYTFLRGLDYLRLTPAIADDRVDDPIELLLSTRNPDGRWPLQKRIPGTLLVDMEKPGQESRWNTLRALRVLRARGR